MEEDLTFVILREIAKKSGIKNYNLLKKYELLEILSKKNEIKEEKSIILNEERLRANNMERYYKGIYD